MLRRMQIYSYFIYSAVNYDYEHLEYIHNVVRMTYLYIENNYLWQYNKRIFSSDCYALINITNVIKWGGGEGCE